MYFEYVYIYVPICACIYIYMYQYVRVYIYMIYVLHMYNIICIYIHKLINLIDQGWAIMCGVTGRSAADISLPEKQHVLCQTTNIRSCDFSVGIYRLFCGMKSSRVASAYLELIHSMLNHHWRFICRIDMNQL